ncbi:hypothetical protein [Halolamina sp.]|uniref:hypothetical protein n=1 Tax=Halolamina sp. TaxID=1940283 RepID=UPI00356A6F7F
MSTGTTSASLGGGVDNDPYVFEVCWRLYRRGERDLLDGGVAPIQVARELGIGRKAAVRSLNRLCDEGVAVKLDGAKPTNLAGRSSYAPVPLYNGGEDGE